MIERHRCQTSQEKMRMRIAFHGQESPRRKEAPAEQLGQGVRRKVSCRCVLEVDWILCLESSPGDFLAHSTSSAPRAQGRRAARRPGCGRTRRRCTASGGYATGKGSRPAGACRRRRAPWHADRARAHRAATSEQQASLLHQSFI